MKDKIKDDPLALVFLLVEGILYVCFLTMDFVGVPGTTALKYLAIVLCAAMALTATGRGTDAAMVAVALCVTAAADGLLLVLDRWYLAGVLLFCAVQFLYALRLYGLEKAAHLRREVALRLLAAAAGEGALIGLRMWDLLSGVAVVYFSQLLCNALLASFCTQKGRAQRLFCVGLWLFMCCDICVGLHNLALYGVAEDALALTSFAAVGMWLFYLPSQVFIVLSGRGKRRGWGK